MLWNRKLQCALVISALLGVGSLIHGGSASADLAQCTTLHGSMRLFDFATHTCVRVFEDGPYVDLGVFGWSNRLDQFGNDGFKNVCLYDGSRCRGTHLLLPMGFAVTWENIVDSWLWVDGGSCPASC